MADDKQKIRDLIDAWTGASGAGDLKKILALMDKDAVFLRAGHPLMRGHEHSRHSFSRPLSRSGSRRSATFRRSKSLATWHFAGTNFQ
jgi:ketosteroid isomerase-like protein